MHIAGIYIRVPGTYDECELLEIDNVDQDFPTNVLAPLIAAGLQPVNAAVDATNLDLVLADTLLAACMALSWSVAQLVASTSAVTLIQAHGSDIPRRFRAGRVPSRLGVRWPVHGRLHGRAGPRGGRAPTG